ncbi:hypothetical protein UE233_11345 [Acinetobacter oleivorans]|uniref:hypothetical protein n=1 Tax=Acinetobacter oleivorans TaxID=1148157 RepID=UPI002AAD5EE8|nr:hypothetical protein [Acinetobacter oleivorans]MDY7373227.1 hypothetical protein [Acinetobacter oleivorans]
MSIQSKKIILVANSDHIFNINSVINDQDLIVRFNIPSKQKIKITGHRTDFLFLANTVDLMERRLRNKEFNNFVGTLKNTNVFFPYGDDLIDKINPIYRLIYSKFFIKFKKDVKNSNNNKYINYFFEKNMKVKVMEQSYYWAAKNLMNKDSSSILTTG